jgi:bifunctional non-homologous end joining protein LigD
MPTKKAPVKRAKKPTAADAVDEQLARYREMRHFDITTEPSGKTKASQKAATLPFVIQKHAASHLHYDFRLGWNGVLKSWAVAKGPSYYTGDRRLAVQVEDHPMEYGGFEGIIPQGQYGGGTVMVWDQGTWSPQPGYEGVNDGLKNGTLKFTMHGKKMKGNWTLVRMNARPGSRWGNSTKPNWLLIKEHDEFERTKDDPAITDEAPNSAVTGRTLDQIAANEDHIWNSKETAKPGQAWYRQPAATVASKGVKGEPPTSPAQRPGSATPVKEKGLKRPKISPPQPRSTATTKLPKETQPDFLPPQLALESTTPPTQTGWLHELKLDGYRIQARKSGNKVQLLTRKGLDWTHRMHSIAAAIAKLPITTATLDGEVVVLGENGTTSFANLQASFQDGANHPLTYFAFDLLHFNGHNTRNLPLIKRKALLAEILTNPPENLRFSEHLETGDEAMFHHACELHAEGIVSKQADAKYTAGRTSTWLKSKCFREQEFVIAGYTLSSEGPDRIGSLLLGYYSHNKLVYAGRTGTGFTQKTKRNLLTQLARLAIKTPAFATTPAQARRDAACWVSPKLVAQVRFATWTADNLVRQAAFLGLRDDKPATEVTREEPTIAPKPKASHRTTASDIAAKRAINTGAPGPDSGTRAVPAQKAKSSPPPSIRLTYPDKILDPESNLTKQQLADYYWAVADYMLPHIADRPLSLVRCPEGSSKPCFFQKHVNHMLPPGVGGINVPNKKTGVSEPYITLNTPEALTGLAQIGVLEIHPWGSTNSDLEHPDRLIFDLDPDEFLPWSTLCSAAAEVRSRLKKAGLESFLKTTGGKGLHIVAPIVPELDWSQLKDLAHNFVLAMERDNTTLYLTKMTKSARVGKIYLDYLRNDRGATAVAPYSPRARSGAHVSLPLPWSALKLPERPVFTVHDFDHWRSRLRTDPWKQMLSLQQRINRAKFGSSEIRKSSR